MELCLGLEMRAAVSPALLAFAEVLALPSAELESLVAGELAANPALERAEAPGPAFQRAVIGASGGDWAPAADWAASRTGAEELLEEVRWCAPPGEAALAAYLIGSLDERGFLPGGPERVAADLSVPLPRVCQALGVLRQVGPPAIGARDVRESLLLQLDTRTPDPRRDLARAIAGRHLETLARGRADAIAAALGTAPAEIVAAVAYIRRHCAPFPAPGLNGPSPASGASALPDVVITVSETVSEQDEGGLRVELVEPARMALRISPGYERLASRESGPDTGRHAAGLVRRASSFISRLEERHRTMRQVAERAANRQREFVLRGPRYLRPLAQADVARDLGVHESTVSRAVAGKYMMLPSRGVVPVQDFFRASLAPQDALRQIVAGEERPLTDTELADALLAQGFRVARRTVAKYRQALGIAAAPLRGSALAPAALAK